VKFLPVQLAVPLDLEHNGRCSVSDSFRKHILCVANVTSVTLLSSPARLQLVYEDRGTRTATYGPNAQLFVWTANKPAQNPSLWSVLSPYTGGGRPEDYWVPINTLLSAQLVPAGV